MHFIEILKNSGVIQVLRGSLRTEAERKQFDEMLESKISEYSDIYETMNAQVSEIKKKVKNANEHGQHRQPEGESDK